MRNHIRFILHLVLLAFLNCHLGIFESQFIEHLLDPEKKDQDITVVYWFYRKRLIERFLLADSNSQGRSLPAARLLLSNGLEWRDATLYLGWYMGVLATEHVLLREGKLPALSGFPNQSVMDSWQAKQETERELILSLQALDRLDKEGEKAFLEPRFFCTAAMIDTPGFFIRDDVPLEFRVGSNPVYYSDFSAPFRDSKISGFADYLSEPNVIFNKEMSQDQVYHLMLGLSLVSHYMQGVEREGIEFSKFAEELAERIIKKISGDSWRIENQACFKRVERGDDARAFSFGTAKALSKITKGRIHIDRSAYLPLWYTIAPPLSLFSSSPIGEIGSLPDNMHMVMTLASIGQGWEDSTFTQLMLYSIAHDWYVYPMLNIALHGKTIDYNRWERYLRSRVIQMLNDIPRAGPSSYGRPNGWRADHRFKRSRTEQERMPVDIPTEYNGLDFMLFHNLSLICGID